MTLRDVRIPATRAAARELAGRPVVLATFDVPVLADASELAVDIAVESGQPLVVVNAVELTIRPMTSSWGAEVIVTDDVDESLRALAVEVGRSPSRSSGSAS